MATDKKTRMTAADWEMISLALMDKADKATAYRDDASTEAGKEFWEDIRARAQAALTKSYRMGTKS